MDVTQILNLESGLYSGTREDGRSCIIERQKGVGYRVSTLQRYGWYEVKTYDENGNFESVTYEK